MARLGARCTSHQPVPHYVGVPTARASGKCSSLWTSNQSAPEALCFELGRGGAWRRGGVPGDAECSPSFLLQSGAMGGKPLSTFYTQLVLMPQVLHYAQYVLLGLGGLLLLVPIIYQLRSQVSRRGGQARDSARVAARICLLQLALVLLHLSHPALTFLYTSWKAQDPPGWVLS